MLEVAPAPGGGIGFVSTTPGRGWTGAVREVRAELRRKCGAARTDDFVDVLRALLRQLRGGVGGARAALEAAGQDVEALEAWGKGVDKAFAANEERLKAMFSSNSELEKT